jgi:hypothetical protein
VGGKSQRSVLLLEVGFLEHKVDARGERGQQDHEGSRVQAEALAFSERVRAAPRKLTAIPTQPKARSRSPRKGTAGRAVKGGAVLIRMLAGSALTVTAP